MSLHESVLYGKFTKITLHSILQVMSENFMSLHGSFLGKCSITNLTLEWLITSVYSLMHSDHRGRTKQLSAISTLVPGLLASRDI